MSTSSLRIGLVGPSQHATMRLLPALAQVAGVRLALVCSRSLDKATELAAHYGAQATTDWHEAFDPALVDGVIVTGPPDLHQSAIRRAREVDLPIYSEKPLARSSAELASAGLSYDRLCVGYNFALSSPLQSLLSDLQGPRNLRHARIGFLTNKPHELLWDCGSVLQSLLLAIGVHPIAMLVNWFGRPLVVQASMVRLDGPLLHLDVAFAFAQGRTATLWMGNFARSFATDYELVLADGTCAGLSNHRDLRITRPVSQALPGGQSASHSPGARYVTDDEAGYVGALTNFAAVIRGEARPAMPFEMSVWVHEAIDTILAQCEGVPPV